MNQQHVSQVYTSPTTKEQINFLCNGMQRHCHVTEGHLRRASSYALALGQRLSMEPKDLETLRIGALLHDVGKLLVPQTILLKPERLTADEFARMAQHPGEGAEWLSGLHWMHDALPILHHHHSQWDGKGYPANIHGYDIPLPARICAIVDAYDACRTDRYYRKGMSRRDAVQVLVAGRGAYYDPELVDLFIGYLKEDGAAEDRVLPLQPYSSSRVSVVARPQRGLLPS